MAEEIKRAYPSLSISHWWNLRNKFKESIPTKISSTYLATVLNSTEDSVKKNVMPSLQIIGLIDKDFSVNKDLADKFRQDTTYKSFCADVLKRTYPEELLDLFSKPQDDRSKIGGWFESHLKVGIQAGAKYASNYVLFLEGDPSKANEISVKKNTNKPIVKKTADKKTAPRNSKSEIPTDTSIPTSLGTTHQKLPELNINMQIHISADATNEQIEKIFESMSKHLMNKK